MCRDLTHEVEALSRTALRQIDSALRSGLPLRASRIGLYQPSNIANLPRAFGHRADMGSLLLAARWRKYLILLVGAQGLEPWTR